MSQTLPRHRIKRPPNLSQPSPSDVFEQSRAGRTGRRRRRYLGNPMKLKRKSAKAACLQILATFGICFIYFYCTSRPFTQCSSHDPLCPNTYFSTSYNEARQKFLEFSSKIHDAKTYHLPITKVETEGGYGVEQTLYTDITIINANANHSDHLIVHISGINGIEGYAGSAVQCAILSEMAEMIPNKYVNTTQKYHRKLMENILLNANGKPWINHNRKQDTDSIDDGYDMDSFPVIMFVHALNPFGMFNGVRVNENNVDLNRNLKTKQQWNEFNNKYEDMDALLNRDYNIYGLVENTDWIPGVRFFKLNWIIHWIWSHIMDWYLKTQMYGYFTIDYDTLFERYNVGQNYDENGLHYVGNKEKETSHVVLMQFLTEMLADREFKKVTMVDEHSGYDEYGRDTVTVNGDDDLKRIQSIGKKFRVPSLMRATLYKDKRFANGPYKNVNGMSYEYVPFIVEQLKNSSNVDTLALLQHYGTYSMSYMLNAVRFHHGYHREYIKHLKCFNENDKEKEKLKLMKFMKTYSNDILKDAFYVKDLDWRRKVINAGYDVFVALYRR